MRAEEPPTPPAPRAPPRRDERAAIGQLGEQLAAAHLERLGFSLLAANVRTRAGEIDLIVSDGRTLVFVEVKTRRRPRDSARAAEDDTPLARLRPLQRARVRHAAVAWLGESRGQRPRALTLRFDAVGVLLDGRGRLLGLEHVEDAW